MQKHLQELRAKYCDRHLDNQLKKLIQGSELVKLQQSEIEQTSLTFKIVLDKSSSRYKQISFLKKLTRNIDEYFLINEARIKKRDLILEVLPEVKNCIPESYIYSQIEADIEKNGLINPILCWQDRSKLIIIDGHDCYESALTLGIEYQVKLVDLDNIETAIALRTQLNLNRRQISNAAKAYYIGAYYEKQKTQNRPRLTNIKEKVAAEYKTSELTIYYYHLFYRLLQKIERLFFLEAIAFRDSVFKDKIRFNLKTSRQLIKLKDSDLHKAITYALAEGKLPNLPSYDYGELLAIPDGKEGVYSGISASGQILVEVEQETVAIASDKVRKVAMIPALSVVSTKSAIAVRERPNTLRKKDVFPFEQLYAQLERGIENGLLSKEQIEKVASLLPPI